MRLHREGVRHRAVPQNLDGLAIDPLDQAGLDETIGIHHAARGETGREILHVHDGILGLAAVRQEAPLGQPAVERHLPALETGPRPATGTCLEPLVAAPRSLPGAGRPPAPHALPLLRRALCGPEILESHVVSTFRQNGTAAIIPRMVSVSSCSTV